MRRALISDIHGNWEALEAVLADIEQQNIDEILCLGDIIGYGPNPRECLDTVMEIARITILGNHDQAVLFDPDGFNPVALQAIFWTRDQLERSTNQAEQENQRWDDFLGELPRSHEEGDYLFVHGSAREPTNEYVFPEDVYNMAKMNDLFGRISHYAFQGHTHIPGIFRMGPDFVEPKDFDYEYSLTDEKIMCNVGSVGQPRDEDPRACYAILDDEAKVISFRRIDYPFNVTAEKIYNIPSLDDMLGNRLKQGR